MNDLLEAGRCLFMAALIWFLVTLVRVIVFLACIVFIVGAIAFTWRLFEIAVAR